MGMFDSVYVKCPNCKEKTACQSKSGPCELNTYELENAPPEVLVGITDGYGWTKCAHCSRTINIKWHPRPFELTIEGEDYEE